MTAPWPDRRGIGAGPVHRPWPARAKPAWRSELWPPAADHNPVHGHCPKARDATTETPFAGPIISDIIEMATSDHVGFDQIRAQHGLGLDQVKALMRQNLKPGSYRAWRKRVRAFSDRREVYK